MSQSFLPTPSGPHSHLAHVASASTPPFVSLSFPSHIHIHTPSQTPLLSRQSPTSSSPPSSPLGICIPRLSQQSVITKVSPRPPAPTSSPAPCPPQALNFLYRPDHLPPRSQQEKIPGTTPWRDGGGGAGLTGGIRRVGLEALDLDGLLPGHGEREALKERGQRRRL